MREIGKYRGQRKDGKGWLEGNVIYANGVAYIFDKEHGSYVDDEDFAAYNLCEVIPETVGMFTGKNDKNGTEIYGGCTCKANWHCAITYDNEPHQIEGTIEWDETCLVWQFDYGHRSVALSDENLTDIEVIDIHEEKP